MQPDIVYLIAPGSSGPAAASLSRADAVRWAAEHYTYPSQIIGVPLVGALPAAPRRGRDPVKHREPGLTFEDAIAGVRFQRTRDLYEEIYGNLLGRSLSDYALIHNLGHSLDVGTWSDAAVRSRRAELVRAGWVIPNGRTPRGATYLAMPEDL